MYSYVCPVSGPNITENIVNTLCWHRLIGPAALVIVVVFRCILPTCLCCIVQCISVIESFYQADIVRVVHVRKFVRQRAYSDNSSAVDVMAAQCCASRIFAAHTHTVTDSVPLTKCVDVSSKLEK